MHKPCFVPIIVPEGVSRFADLLQVRDDVQDGWPLSGEVLFVVGRDRVGGIPFDCGFAKSCLVERLKARNALDGLVSLDRIFGDSDDTCWTVD